MNWIKCTYYTPWLTTSRGEESNDYCVDSKHRTAKPCDRCIEKNGGIPHPQLN
ncbi:MAG: hypothetical protein IJ879_10815 [Muribaculaceae bacterium]|nr:hypothetical protein [Muribaculaceae bacterium]